MNKRGFEIGKLGTLILVVIAIVVIVWFFRGKFSYGAGIFSTFFGAANESASGVLKDWETLTPKDRDKLSDAQKADSILQSAERSFTSGVTNRNVDDLKKAQSYAEQVIALRGLAEDDKRKTRARQLLDEIKKYIHEFSIAEILTRASYQQDLRQREASYEQCVRDFKDDLSVTDCIARLFLLRNYQRRDQALVDAIRSYVRDGLAKAQSAKERAQIRLAGGLIYENSFANDHGSAKDLIQEALREYTLITDAPEFQMPPDYVGRAYLNKAALYLRHYQLFGLGVEEGRDHARLQYENLFRALGKTEFLDKRTAQEKFAELSMKVVVVVRGQMILPNRDVREFTVEKIDAVRQLPADIVVTFDRDALRPQGISEFKYVDVRPSTGPRVTFRVLDGANRVICEEAMTDESGRIFLFALATAPARSFAPPLRLLPGTVCHGKAHVDLVAVAADITPQIENDAESLEFRVVRAPIA